jgi:hypothetical protein
VEGGRDNRKVTLLSLETSAFFLQKKEIGWNPAFILKILEVVVWGCALERKKKENQCIVLSLPSLPMRDR